MFVFSAIKCNTALFSIVAWIAISKFIAVMGHFGINYSAALCILTCALLFHFGIELEPVLKNFVVKLCEGGHLNSESRTACRVSLKHKM